MKVQIKGLIRFSYPCEGGFNRTDWVSEDPRDTLYDPVRLERRFAMFQALTLRTLALQKDAAFQIGVLIGNDFPASAREHLTYLLQQVPQAQIIALPPEVHYLATKQAFARMPDDPEATHVATFRLDDDDGMHRLTTQRIQRLARALLQVRDPDAPFVISFNRGFYLNARGARANVVERFESTPIGIGLSLVAPKGYADNIFRRNHRKLGQYFDCYSEIERPMFIRSMHEANDSGAKPTGQAGALSRGEVIRTLKRGFGVTLKELKELAEARQPDAA
ncbi:MAG: glycosyltransferase [Pseudomonadota bacterium]